MAAYRGQPTSTRPDYVLTTDRRPETVTSSAWIRFRKNRLQLLSSVASTGLLCAVILYVLSTSWAQFKSDRKLPLDKGLKADVGTTLAIIRVLQGILAAMTSFALSRSFYYLQWGMVQRPTGEGLSYLGLLALSPSTFDWGTYRIMFSRSSTLSSRLLGLLRLSLIFMVWSSGLILFLRTSLVTVFDTAHTYDVTAGVGPFNSSLVGPFLEELRGLSAGYQHEVVPYSYFATLYGLITNPVISTVAEPVQCQNDGTNNCASYFLSGGVYMTTPWMPGGYLDSPLVRIEGVPTVQVEFDSKGEQSFAQSDCEVFGGNTTRIAAQVCVARIPGGALKAGLYLCANGTTAEGGCRTTNPTANMTTTVTFYRRRATILASTSNFSVTFVSDVTVPEILPMAVTDEEFAAYKAALNWVLNYTAADIPAPSSIIEGFWTASRQLNLPTVNRLLVENFQGILAFPLWHFNANNYGNPNLNDAEMNQDLPREFYTRASIVTPYIKIKFDTYMFVIFGLFQGLPLLFVWAVLVWAFMIAPTLPAISSFPLFDISFKSQAYMDPDIDQNYIWHADDREILDTMRVSRVQRKQGWSSGYEQAHYPPGSVSVMGDKKPPS